MNIKTIFQQIDKTVKRYDMLADGESVVLGVSGGADSMLMLHYFLSKGGRYRLIVANVEHGIRGESSVRDSEFVRDFCREKGLEFHCLTIDAPALAAKSGEGVESYSRKRRYAFFESFGADKIATAHNLSDNAETFLFRLSRGMSGKGACGIPPVRGNIIRPLLECSARDIRSACEDAGIPYVTDETNADNRYSRNYIRNVIVPAFEEMNPHFEEATERFIRSQREQSALIERLTEEAFTAAVCENSIDLKAFRAYDTVIQKGILCRLYPFDDAGLSAMTALVKHPGRVQLSECVYAISDRDTLRIAEFSDDKPVFSVQKQVISREAFDGLSENEKKEFLFACDNDKVVGEVCVRSRNEGDRITLAGRNCTKSLKKLFIEKRIPAENRNRIPVLYDSEGIIGVYTVGVDERVHITDETKSVCLISIHTEDFI